MGKSKLAALACILMAISSTCSAVSRVTASVTELGFELVDLNTEDGLTPYFNVSNTWSWVSAQSQGQSANDSGVAWLASLAANASLGRVDTAARLAEGKLALTGQADEPYTNFFSQGSMSATIALAPQSQLIIRATAVVTAEAIAETPANCGQGCAPGDAASGSISMRLSSPDRIGNPEYLDNLYVGADVHSDYYEQVYILNPDTGVGSYEYQLVPGGSQSKSASKNFLAVLTNASDSVKYAVFAMGSNVLGSATLNSTPAVPEPGTGALALLGLGVFRVVSARRRLVRGPLSETEGL